MSSAARQNEAAVRRKTEGHRLLGLSHHNEAGSYSSQFYSEYPIPRDIKWAKGNHWGVEHGRIDNTPASKLIRNITLSFSKFEHDLIVQRTPEGKTIARQNVDFKDGRTNKYGRVQFAHVLELLERANRKHLRLQPTQHMDSLQQQQETSRSTSETRLNAISDLIRTTRHSIHKLINEYTHTEARTTTNIAMQETEAKKAPASTKRYSPNFPISPSYASIFVSVWNTTETLCVPTYGISGGATGKLLIKISTSRSPWYI